MASTLGSTRTEPRFDDGTPPTVPQEALSGIEATLAKLAQQAASDTRTTRSRSPASDKSADAPVSPPSAAATPEPATLAPTPPATPGPVAPGPAMLGPADRSAQIAREQPSRGKGSIVARVAIAICLITAALWAWRSYGGIAKSMVAALAAPTSVSAVQPAAEEASVPAAPNAAPEPAPNPAPDPSPTQATAPPAIEPQPPPPVRVVPTAEPAATPARAPPAPAADQAQNDAMARDIVALRQSVEQLTAAQAQLKDEIAKLRAEKVAAVKPPAEKPKKRVVRQVPPADHPSPAGPHLSDAFDPAQSPSAPGAPRSMGSVVVHREAPPPANGVSTVNSLPPPDPSDVRRPPAPVPQP